MVLGNIDRWTDNWREGWTDRWLDGWMDRWMDEWILHEDRWMNYPDLIQHHLPWSLALADNTLLNFHNSSYNSQPHPIIIIIKIIIIIFMGECYVIST